MFRITSEQIDNMIKTQNEDVLSTLEELGNYVLKLGMEIEYVEETRTSRISSKKELKGWINELRKLYE